MSTTTLPSVQDLYTAAKEFLSRHEIFLPTLTQGEKLILEAQVLTLQALLALPQSLAQALQAVLPSTVQSSPEQTTGTTTPTPNILSLSIRLDELLETIVAIPQVQTYLAGSANQLAVTVPAGGSTQVVIPLAPGYVLGFLSDIMVTPSSTQAGVTLSVTIDGYNLIGPEGFVLGPSITLPVSQFNYFATRTGVVATLTNPSSTNVTVYFSFEMVNVATVFYEQFIEPIFKQIYQQIKSAYGIKGV